MCRPTLALLLIVSTIREFCIGSAVGIRGSMLSVLTHFLSNQSQYVLVDGCRSKLVNIVSGDRSAAGQCFGPVVDPSVHLGPFFHSGE